MRGGRHGGRVWLLAWTAKASGRGALRLPGLFRAGLRPPASGPRRKKGRTRELHLRNQRREECGRKGSASEESRQDFPCLPLKTRRILSRAVEVVNRRPSRYTVASSRRMHACGGHRRGRGSSGRTFVRY